MPSSPPRSRRETEAPTPPVTKAVKSATAATSPHPLGEAFVAVVAAVEDALDAFLPGRACVAVAISGGVDSMVLLDALAHIAKDRPLELSAVHVHHGLSANADDWARFCAERCASLGIPLTVHRVRIARAPGKSLEALARTARYEQFMACEVDAVALAHHADDQAETVLLQMLRGAGPRGLSAMPAFRRGTPALLRPLLSLMRKTLAAYAASRGLAWIEDESNRDTRHRRNFLRQEISPRLAARFAGYPATLVRVAAHQAEASALLDELAALDAEGALDAGGLDRAHLAGLPDARAANLLRWFLRHEGLRPPSDARLADVLRQLRSASADAHTRIAHDGAELGCHRGRVMVHAPAAAPFAVAWTGDAEVRLPGGVLAFETAAGEGIADAKLALAPVTVRSREGGERIRLAANRPRHAVKNLLQRAGMPVWQRQSLPLVWCGDELAAIPGVGVDVAFQAAAGETGWRLTWRPAC